MKRICFIFAMHAEAAPLIKHFGLRHFEDEFRPLPVQSYRGIHNGIEIDLVLNGVDATTGLDYIGCEAATLTTHLAIARYKPHLLINAGTAGAFASKGARIGDVYISHKNIVFHDRRVQIPGWEWMSIGYYPCIDTDRIAAELNLKQAICTTGSSLDLPEVDLEQIHRLGGEVKDMEAAAIAYVASLHKIPLLCVKSITDLLDTGRATEVEFKENLEFAANRLMNTCYKLIGRFDLLEDVT